MEKVKVIYGSSNGNTQEAATLIATELGGEAINVSSATPADFNSELIVLGTSTWGIGDIQDDWSAALPMLDKVDWSGKKVALFGLGDQMSFGDSYIDGVRDIYDRVTAHQVPVIGEWRIDGYQHSGSRAVIDGQFIGLALDADNQAEMTPQRVREWCKQLRDEMQA